MLGLLVQNQSHRAGTHLRGKLLRRIAHQTFFSGEMVSANPGAVHCALQAHGIQSPVMATAAKPNQQPCTESCVVSGNGHEHRNTGLESAAIAVFILWAPQDPAIDEKT